MRRPATLKEMRDWNAATPKDVPAFVYGRHALETPEIEKNDVKTIEACRFKVFRVPARETVLSDKNLEDREKYNRTLARMFSGRTVIDLHTSPGDMSFFAKRFSKRVIGLEVPAHEISRMDTVALVRILAKKRK
jgi:hypothetical protein